MKNGYSKIGFGLSCPMAWDKLVKFHETKYPEIDHPNIWGIAIEITSVELRSLYEFFDENEIYVMIIRPERFYDFAGWGYEVQHITRDRHYGYPRRIVAEYMAFEYAFIQLENKLKGQNIN